MIEMRMREKNVVDLGQLVEGQIADSGAGVYEDVLPKQH